MIGVAAAGQTALADQVADLERQLMDLRRQVDTLSAAASEQEKLTELARRIEILAAEIERLRLGEEPVTATESHWGLGPAASKVYRTRSGVSLGGYGELLYEDPSGHRQDGAPSRRRSQADFLRAVLYVGYKFDDRFLLNTEFEFEHATTSDGRGEVSVEFAYLDYLWRPEINLRAGMVLLPMGFLNELHEPTTFPTARRPAVEQAIIPSTWRENGFGLFGELGDFTYRTYVVTGLDGSRFSAAGFRAGRQKGGRALSEDLAWVGRMDYEGAPGVLLGASVYLGNSGQGIRAADGTRIKARTSMVEAHLQWDWQGLEIRALAVRANQGDAGDLNRHSGLTGADSIGRRLHGGYMQVAYDLFSRTRYSGRSLSPFIRWERLDTQRSVPDGWQRSPARDQRILTLGTAYQPLDAIILKVDYQQVRTAGRTGVDQVNVALGYIF